MLIDWSRVSELKSEIGADDFADVVEIFLEEVEDVMTDLSKDRDAQALEAQLHFLKGSALNLGFAEFAQLCQTGETRAAQDPNAAVDLDLIRESYARSRQEFLKTRDLRNTA